MYIIKILSSSIATYISKSLTHAELILVQERRTLILVSELRTLHLVSSSNWLDSCLNNLLSHIFPCGLKFCFYHTLNLHCFFINFFNISDSISFCLVMIISLNPLKTKFSNSQVKQHDSPHLVNLYSFLHFFKW